MSGRMGRPAQQDDTFAYDPSSLRDEIAGTIPQALFMMNSPRAGGAIDGDASSLLTRMLKDTEDDDALIAECYLRCFSREPEVI